MTKLTYSDSPFFSNWSQTYFTNLPLKSIVNVLFNDCEGVLDYIGLSSNSEYLDFSFSVELFLIAPRV